MRNLSSYSACLSLTVGLLVTSPAEHLRPGETAGRGAFTSRASVPLLLALPDESNPTSLPILGLLLNTLANRIDSSVEKAASRADELFIRGGSEANAAINNIRAAYPELLDQTIDKLDGEGAKMLARVQATAAALEGQTAKDAQTLTQMLTQDLLILPLSNRRPQLTMVSPAYEIAAKDAKAAGIGDSILIQVHGVFPNAGEQGLTPSLQVGPKTFTPFGGTQDLLFVIPRKLLTVASRRNVAYTKMRLTAPYTERGGLRDFFAKQTREATFNLTLIGLPATPGTIQVLTSKPVMLTDRVHVSTIQYNVQSDRDDHDLDVCGPNEDASRTIVANTVQLVIDKKEGGTSTNRPVRVNNPSVCWHWRTEHHGAGTSDKVWFHFEYDVTVPRPSVAVTTIPLDSMRWGDSRVVDLAGASYVVQFTAFDGSKNQYAAQTQSDRFITVAPEGASGLRVAVRSVSGILPVAR